MVTALFTSHTAIIMLLSVVPLIMIQIPTVFKFSYAGERTFLLITLGVSIMFLVWYFFYQVLHFYILVNINLLRINACNNLCANQDVLDSNQIMYILFVSYIEQLFRPAIQRRRLMYIKHEHLVFDILNRVQNQTSGKLLTENGSPNVSTIRR